MSKKEVNLLTITQAAEIVGCDSSTLRRAVRGGGLPATKLGNQWIVERSALDKWLQAGGYHPTKVRR